MGETHRRHGAVARLEAGRHHPVADHDSVGLRQFLFPAAGLHVAGAAAVGDGHLLGAEAARLDGGVDRRHAAADDDDPAADRHGGFVGRLPQDLDEAQRVDDVALRLHAGERVDAAEPQAEEDRVMPAAQRGEIDVDAEPHDPAPPRCPRCRG